MRDPALHEHPFGLLRDDADAAASAIASCSLAELLEGRCDPEITRQVVALVQGMHDRRISPIDVLTLERLYNGAAAREQINAFVRQHCARIWYQPYLLLAFLVFANKIEAGIHLARGAVVKRCPSLVYDPHGLLSGPIGSLQFERDAVVAGQRLLRYHPDLCRFVLYLTDGFIEVLLKTWRRHQAQTTSFGLAINPNYVGESATWHPSITLARIYGPPALTEERLRDPRFPQDAAGTVTEYRRLTDDPRDELVHGLAPFVDRLQVFWSRRRGIKSIQVEEILKPEASVLCHRYLHARWDETAMRFIHLDGAVRIYDALSLSARVSGGIAAGRALTARYTKLFRLDCPLSLQELSDLAVRYYYGNELMAEYLAAELT